MEAALKSSALVVIWFNVQQVRRRCLHHSYIREFGPRQGRQPASVQSHLAYVARSLRLLKQQVELSAA
jgi:hypothetical protein